MLNKIEPIKNNQITLDELHKQAKNSCSIIASYYAKGGSRQHEGHVSTCRLHIIPFKETHEAFKKNDPHEIIRVVIKIANQLAKCKFGKDHALTLLTSAKNSPISDKQYGNNFFNHKSCLEKINSCYEKIYKKLEDEKFEAQKTKDKFEENKEIYGRWVP